ncbi:MAG: ATPase [Actinoallomurus sp.]|jgi:anti-sigma regulatory factor (Ser/Thr protein kinase)|nr:ATPase [Actinoallomurus sp.]
MGVTEDQLPASEALSFAALDSAVPAIRGWVRITMRELGRPDRSTDAELIISELVTNAVHAAPGEILKVTAVADGGESILAVWDPGPGVPVVAADLLGDLENDDFDRNGGRGLFLVMAVATEWGYTPTPENGGKWVWARL